MAKNKNILLVLSLLFCLITSCSNNTIFQDAKMISEDGWCKDDYVSFDYTVTDTIGKYDLIVDIRNDEDYPFKNFWLFIHTTLPDGTEYPDTLECVLADNYGKWIGKSSGSMHNLPVYFSKDIVFPQLGEYRFKLVQGMRADTLQGITEIGLRIAKSTTEENGKE